MFDFFSEIADNTGQLVTIGNYFISGITNFITSVRANEYFITTVETISRFPGPVCTLILPYISMKIFDFARGR